MAGQYDTQDFISRIVATRLNGPGVPTELKLSATQIMGYIQMAQRWLVDQAIQRGVDTVRSSILFSVSANATYSGVSNYFYTPVWLWEREDGTDDDFTPMVRTSPLPVNYVTIDKRRWWDFYDNIFHFLPATIATEFKCQFYRQLADLTSPRDLVELRDAADAIGYYAAGSAMLDQGRKSAEGVLRQAENRMEMWVNIALQVDQQSPSRRRRPLPGIRWGF